MTKSVDAGRRPLENWVRRRGDEAKGLMMSKREWWIVALMGALLYATVARLRFRFAHPCLTDTQLMLKMFAALAWKTIVGAC